MGGNGLNISIYGMIEYLLKGVDKTCKGILRTRLRNNTTYEILVLKWAYFLMKVKDKIIWLEK